MAKRIFYGICNSKSEEVFTVTLQDSTLTDLDSFNFEAGDLLAVYFCIEQDLSSDKNPKLRIQVTDSNENITIESDDGRFVKVYNTTAPKKMTWKYGEVVLFCYTISYSETPDLNFEIDTAYWNMVTRIEADETYYGVTRLFNLNENDISSWYQRSDDDITDISTAVDPSFLRKVLKGVAQLSYEEEPIGEDPRTIGTLTNGLGTSIALRIPKEREIAVPSSTRDIANQGPNPNNANNWIGNGAFYITNELDGYNLYFPTTGNGIVFNSSTPAGNKPFIVTDSNRRIVIDGADKPVILQSTGQYAASSKGNFIIDEGGLTVDKDGLIKGNLNVNKQVSANTLKGNEIYENNISLKDKYAYKLTVFELGDPSWIITLESNKSKRKEFNLHNALTGFSIPGPAKNWGWEPLGIIGWNWSYAGTTESDAAYVSTWEMFIKDRGKNSGILQYAIKNFGTRTIKVYLKVQILCWLRYYPSN